MRTRSKAKGPVKKGAGKNSAKSDPPAETPDELEATAPDQKSIAESTSPEQKPVAELTAPELKPVLETSPEEKSGADESPASPANLTGDMSSEVKPEPCHLDSSSESAAKGAGGEFNGKVENSVGDDIKVVALNEELLVEVKEVGYSSVEETRQPIGELEVVVEGAIEVVVEGGPKEEKKEIAGEVKPTGDVIEVVKKEEQSAKADELMTEVLEVQAEQGAHGAPGQTLDKGEETGIDGEKAVEGSGEEVVMKEVECGEEKNGVEVGKDEGMEVEGEVQHQGVEVKEVEHGEKKNEAEVKKDEGMGFEGEVQNPGEEVVKDAEEGAEIGEEYPDVQQSLPIFERHRRKRLEVFVGGIDKEATEEDIKEVFKAVGEVTEVRLMKNPQTGKNKGYAFVRYATLEQAKRAAAELDRIQVRGKACGVLPSDENDTLFLGNINKTWKKEAVMEKLTGYGVESMEELTLMADPQNEGSNRGFAFLEFTTHKDALKAFKRLQEPDAIFGADRSAKVAWAQPLNEPDEDSMAQVKSVFVDGMPPTWDEDKVKEHFGKFGEIERVVLARNMSSAKRKDFGFVNFSSREAAVACIEALNNSDVTDGDTKMKVKVMLAKPQTKNKPFKGGVRGGYPVQSGGSKPAGGSEGGRGRGGGGGGTATRGGRGSGRGGRGATGRSVSGRQSFRDNSGQHQLLRAAAYNDRARGGFALASGNVRGGYPGHYELIHPSARDVWPVGHGAFGGVYAGRAGYPASLPAGRPREGFQGQPFGQPMDRSLPTGYNRGMAAAAAAVREYGVAVPGVKRAYSAMEDPRYADASLRNQRARVEPPVGVGGSQYAGEHLHGNTARASVNRAAQFGARGGPGVSASGSLGHLQQPGLVGGMYPSGSHVHNAAYPPEYLASGAEMRGEPVHPSVYGAPAGPGGYALPGTGTGAYY